MGWERGYAGRFARWSRKGAPDAWSDVQVGECFRAERGGRLEERPAWLLQLARHRRCTVTNGECNSSLSLCHVAA